MRGFNVVSNSEVNISYTDFYIESKSKETEKLSIENAFDFASFCLSLLFYNQPDSPEKSTLQ